MNNKCTFDSGMMQFKGTPLEQAQGLLRFPKILGNVDDTLAKIPQALKGILSNLNMLGFTKERLRRSLNSRGILEANIGGSLDEAVSRANNNDEAASFANYFVIHDTSTLLSDNEIFDPTFINSSNWSGNHLETLGGVTHVFITRNGRTKTDNNYQTPFRATKFESSAGSVIHKGRFLHHEMVQPRKTKNGIDCLSPDPGFTLIQYELLAFCYLAASLRRGCWLIPAFHCVLDLEVGDHDDPQRFDLMAWDKAISTLLSEMANNPNPNLGSLKSNFLKDDPALQKVARGELTLVATGGIVAGIGAVQDAFNFLASSQPDLRIDLAGNRGFFGPRTKAAITVFQGRNNLPKTGKVDSSTLLLLDGIVATP
jgi:peptidoglycan hydrolase-like protein with peptidoglycan-binding domain